MGTNAEFGGDDDPGADGAPEPCMRLPPISFGWHPLVGHALNVAEGAIVSDAGYSCAVSLQAESSARDQWMRRAGPFYPLLVAAREQTRLVFLRDLEPTEIDRRSSLAWSPIVGALLGLGLGFMAALVGGLGIGEVAIAALVATAWVLAGGAWSESGLSNRANRWFGDARDSEGVSAPVAFTLVLVVSLLLRATLLTSIYFSVWTSALLAAAVVARWAPIASAQLREGILRLKRRPRSTDTASDEEDASSGTPPSESVFTTGLGLVSAAVVLVLPIILGIPGLLAVLAGLGWAMVAAFRKIESAELVLLTELTVLLTMAATHTYPIVT